MIGGDSREERGDAWDWFCKWATVEGQHTMVVKTAYRAAMDLRHFAWIESLCAGRLSYGCTWISRGNDAWTLSPDINNNLQ